jgi:oligopeptide transport system substrate-binding protein
MKEWVHDSHIVMVANPFWPDNIPSVPKPKIEEIVFRMLDESPAFAEYEAGNLDVAGVPLSEIDRVKADPKLSQELKIAPILCTYYYGFNVTKPPFDDARMRLAFSLAVDRKAIVENVTKGGQEPAQWFSRPGLQAAPTLQTHPNLGVKYDPERAKQLFQEVLKEKYGGDVKNLPPITLMVNQVEGHIKIAEAIQQMWKEVLGVDVKLETQEWKVYLKTLQTDPPQVWRLGWCQDYPHASNFLKDVFYSTSDNNHTKWGNPEFDRLVDQALRETDENKARELYAQAEDILVAKDAAIIPIYWYTRVTVTKPYVKRTFSVLGGLEHIEKWDIQQ